MKAENQTTGHNRTIRFTDIPSDNDPGHKNDVRELLVHIKCVENHEEGVVFQAIALDHVVIPAIIQAINASPWLPIPKDIYERLRQFAAENGRTWRAKLRRLWNTGKDEGLLRQARNIVGPSKLDKLRF